MFDQLLPDILPKVYDRLSQEDKCTLSYVNKKFYSFVIPRLYENLYLNDRPYFPVKSDPSIGTHYWSVLYYTYGKTYEVSKLACLLRSLIKNPILFTYIKRVHCSWHIDNDLLLHFIFSLCQFANNLDIVENFLSIDIAEILVSSKPQLKSLILPPAKPGLPNMDLTNDNYYSLLYNKLWNRIDYNNLRYLTLHVNPLTFFHNFNDNPLKIKSLCLNVRPDTFNPENVTILPNINQITKHYYDIFDVNYLEEFTVQSWYELEEEVTKVNQLWKLDEFIHFKNIKSITLSSIFPDRELLHKFINNFDYLSRIKLDYIHDAPLFIDDLIKISKAKCAKNIRTIHTAFKDDNIIPVMKSFLLAPINGMDKIRFSCPCDRCKKTFKDILLKKYFPPPNGFKLRDGENFRDRLLNMQLFVDYPILPYSQSFDEYPAICYGMRPINEFADQINQLFGYDNSNNPLYITTSDAQELYFLFLHEFKRAYNLFLQYFPNLGFLTLNGIPTRVESIGGQKCNIPLFYDQGYTSNQIYEVADAESLFS